MPPKRQSRPFSRTLSNTSNTSNSSSSKGKLKQNKLDFSFHSTSSSATRSFGSRPLSSTPSFGLPTAVVKTPTPAPLLDKGKQREQEQEQEQTSSRLTKVENHELDASEHGADLWSERLAPQSGDELAVHPRKVAQVRAWLADAFSSSLAVARRRKVLALTGPAGAGKSATIRALAASTDLDFDILEWHNDQTTFDPSAPGPSFVERFNDFLSKAAKFPTLDLQPSSDNIGASVSYPTLDSESFPRQRRLVLIDDLPNLHHLPTKQLFQASIEQHIQQSTWLSTQGFPNVPIVLIVTECTPREDEDRWIGDSSSSNWRERIASIMDTRTALGDNIRRDPSYTEVRFNPVAPTIVLKGLKRAIERAKVVAGKMNQKALLELLQAIAEDSNGDLRAAVNCLEFVGANSEHFGVIARQKDGKRKEEGKRAMRKLIPLVSGRESSLALFHALGKVLYNKREGDPGDEATPNKTALYGNGDDDSAQEDEQDDESTELKRRLKAATQSIVQSPLDDTTLARLPDHILHLERRSPRVSVDLLWADLPVDSSVFQLYLHQNFPQFCTEVEQCESILEDFSLADTLTPLHEQYRHTSLLAYYAFLISTRATLLHLPSPVPRNGQKLGKAIWWDVQKKLRGNLQEVDEFKTSGQTGARGRVDQEDDARGRFKRTKFSHPALEASGSFDQVDRTDAGMGEESKSTLLRSNAVTLVTEVLPLLAKIRPAGMDSKVYNSARMRFEYAGVADMASRTLDEHETGIDDDNEDDDAPQPSGALEETSAKGKQAELPKAQQETEEPSFLEEDDIVDF